jgi:hypothetical protein
MRRSLIVSARSTTPRGHAARRGTAVLALSLFLATAVLPQIGEAADPRLDTALAALAQAENLLEASEPGIVDEKTERRFERLVARAIRLILGAMEAIEAAKDAVDNP